MMRKNVIFLICILLRVNLTNSQNLLNKPEHIVYDTINQRYLITNYGDGKVISIDQFEKQEVIIQGITDCLGIHIVDTTIFVSAGSKIYLFGIQSLKNYQTITLQVSTWLDGMIDDCSGYLYVVENAGRIHRINLSSYADTIIVNSGLPENPQDLTYDSYNNRLILVSWQTSSPITAIDINSFEVSVLSQTTSGQFDGIAIDNQNSIYVSSWLNGGRVLKWIFPYNGEPEIFSQGHAGPAGLCFDLHNSMLAVPNFNGNSISFVTISRKSAEKHNSKPNLQIWDTAFQETAFRKRKF